MKESMEFKDILLKILVLLIIILLILIGFLIKSYLINKNKGEVISSLNKDFYNQVDQYLNKKKRLDLRINNKINDRDFSKLNKIRSALLLYINDNQVLPKRLDDLVGEYLVDIPIERFSGSRKVKNELDFTGGWYYNPSQIYGESLLKVIEISVRANIKGEYYQSEFLPYRVMINRSKKRLYLMKGDAEVTEYPVAVGGEGSPTPAGEFKINSKERLSASQRRIYGVYWIGLDLWTKGGGYGIHASTNSEIKLTDQSSRGCIRMKKGDLEELYEFIPLRTEVIIE